MAEPAGFDAVRRFLTFRANGQLYALPASEVAEIIAMPPVARLPQSPKALLGIGNLRGTVIAIASLRALLGAPEPDGGSSRAIVLDGGSLIAITVDTIEGLTVLDGSPVETQPAKLAANAGELLRGAFQDASRAAVKILDITALLARAFAPRSLPKQNEGLHVSGRLRTGQDHALLQAESKKLLTFEVASQAYALPLSEVWEIIALPAEMAAVPHAEALILGLAPYRDTLLPLLSLRGLLGFPLRHEAECRVIVTAVAGMPVGLVADRMRDIVQADMHAIEPAPALLTARAGGEARIHSIYHGKNSQGENSQLVSLLAADQLFGDDVMARLGNHSAGELPVLPAAAAASGQTLQFLVFRVAGEEFALPLSAVDEVAAAPEHITRLPKTPKFLSGVINLRGGVLPVIDQRSRFGLPKFDPDSGPDSKQGSGQYGRRQRLVVMRSARHQAGLIVDAISEILMAAAETVEPAPHLAGEESRLVRGVLNLVAASRLILVLDPDELLTRTERSLLDEFNARTGKTPKPQKTAPADP